MKKSFLVALGLGITLTAQAQIKFEEGKWADIKAKAKKEKKMIFIDAYTTWCGPCKWLAANVFTDKNVGEYHNANFINYKMDMEKGEGPEFAQQFKVSAYPTLLYFTKDGELAHRLVGAMPAESLLSSSKDAKFPEKQYYTLLKKYDQGERKADFLRNMIDAATSAGDEEKASEIATAIFNTLNKNDWSKPENLKIVGMMTTSFDSPTFEALMANKDKLSKEDLQGAMSKILDGEFGKVLASKDEAKMRELQGKITKYFPEFATEINPKVENYFYQQTGNTKKAEENLAKSEDWNELNSKAWAIYENETSTEQFEKALGWAKRSIELEENFYNTDTYAHLAYKLGKKEEAIKYAKRAIELGKAAGEDTSATQALLKKIHESK